MGVGAEEGEGWWGGGGVMGCNRRIHTMDDLGAEYCMFMFSYIHVI